MVKLSSEEKREMCSILASHLPKIRELLGVTQGTFGSLCGLSRITISRIENGSARMNWSHLTSIMFVCAVNRRTKEYFYANNLLGVRFLQFMQQKDANIPPETNIVIDLNALRAYAEEV
ncbi:MAG: helix-turn-helix domain-containing protein [Clostridia bacterium]|nr:helix-turn-helix domain-containing protein [Clostridia bacterium]